MATFEGGVGIDRDDVQDDMIFDLAGNLVLHGDGQILFAYPLTEEE